MKILSNIILILLFSLNLYSQDIKLENKQSIDKIVAIVGNEIVLASEVDAQMARMLQQDNSLNFYDTEKRKEVLNALIDEKLLIQKAEKDSIQVSDQEIEQRWDQLLAMWKSQYGSVSRIEQLFGKTLSRIKLEFRDQIKNQILTQKLNYTKFGELSISTNEVHDFYNKFKDSLKYMPDQYEVAHIVINVKVDNSSKEKAYNIAKSIRDSILKGADFAKLALNNSDDQTTSKDGGELGWVKKGLLFPEFEKAAFSLTTGETSLPIETPFGYHIIQTIEKKADQVKTRHILIKFNSSNNNQDKVLELLKNIKEDVLNKKNTFSEMAAKYSEDENTKGFGGVIGKVTLQDLPTQIQTKIKDMKEGDISDILSYGNDPNKPAFQIFYFQKFYPQHKMNIEEDYESIEIIAKNYKQRELVQDWIVELRKELHWEIVD